MVTESASVTFMIATRNRVGELVKTLQRCRTQDWPNKQILVVDDPSTDGTYETVRTRFPEVNIVRREKKRGSIWHRRPVSGRALKISLSVNLVSTDDPQAANQLAKYDWWTVLTARTWEPVASATLNAPEQTSVASSG